MPKISDKQSLYFREDWTIKKMPNIYKTEEHPGGVELSHMIEHLLSTMGKRNTKLL